MNKIIRLLLTTILLTATTNIAKAEEEADTAGVNKAVEGAEVVPCVFNDAGILEPIGAPLTTDSEGNVTVDLSESLPGDKAVFLVTQDASGEGTQQISYLDQDAKGETTIEPMDTAIMKTLITFMSEAPDIDPASVSGDMVEKFTASMEKALEEVPLAEDTAATASRYADALSLQPDAFLTAATGFNVDPEDMLKVAAMVGDAAAASFDPLSEHPEPLGDISPGSATPGLIPPELMKKFTPKDFDFNATFGDNIMPPGGLKGMIPPGSFMMPAGVALNPAVQFPNEPVLPQGVTIPKGFQMPPNAVLPPGIIVGEGFVPPAGLQFPPGMIAPPGFNPEAFGAKTNTTFTAPEGFVPSPGFAVTGSDGGFGMPSGFPLPKGFEMPAGAMNFPPPPGFSAPPLPAGFSKAESQPFPADFTFPAGAIMPPTFNPSGFGEGFNFTPPANFVPMDFSAKGDFSAFKAEGFTPLDPMKGFDPKSATGGFVGPPLGTDGKPVAGFFDPNNLPSGVLPPANFGQEGFDPFAGFKPPTPGAGGTTPTGPATPPTGGATGPATPGTGGTTPTDGVKGPAVPPTGGTTTPVGGSSPVVGGGTAPAVPPTTGTSVPAPTAPAPSAPPPPPAGGEVAPPPPPPARTVAKTAKAKFLDARKRNSGRTLGTASLNTLGTGQVTNVIVSAPEGTNAKVAAKSRITASDGVYLAGKLLRSTDAISVPVLIDPSTSKTSVKVTLNIDNKVESTDLDVEATAVQLVTQLDGSTIQVSTTGTDVTFTNSSVTGYLLPPGSSASGLKKAIRMTGTVVAGDDTSVVNFKKPAAAKTAGIYTVVFTDGEAEYFGKVTIGTLKAKSLKCKVVAPGGAL